ncbi:MAG: methylated-DNA--[protein]-cysteine S-methyltransferase [Eubacteriales bacterium]|nr:methylated-DNA--[protein]-cysteine S-methyltransferase [Eubacteriales bacterium]
MIYDSPAGRILLTFAEGAVTGLYFEGQKNAPLSASPDRVFDARVRNAEGMDAARRWLDAYFSGENPGEPPALRLSGTAFERRVWEALRRIPYGTVTTYGALARQLGTGARAVGRAVGRNPMSIFVPCHRVIGADGTLTGYAGGVERKRFLLALEGALPVRK